MVRIAQPRRRRSTSGEPGATGCVSATMTTHRLSIERTYPDDDRYWQVREESGDFVGIIVDCRDQTIEDRPAWFWAISVFGMPQPGIFRGDEWTREDAVAKIHERWPAFRAQFSDEEYE